MTTDDRILSGASSESSLPPNKSSGDIGDRTWTPEQFWEFATAFLGDHEANTSRDMIESRGLVLIPDAEIERLRRERDEAVKREQYAIRWANASVDSVKEVVDVELADLKSERDRIARNRDMWKGQVDRQADRIRRLQPNALTAESAVSAAYENAAKIAEAKALEFLSPEYATGQPLSSFNERFACEQVASAIRAAGSKKTAESGHSPSTHNLASE